MAGSILLVQQPQALTQNGNPYTPSRIGSGAASTAGFALGVLGAMSTDTYKNAANEVSNAFKNGAGLLQKSKAAGVGALLALGVVTLGAVAAKIIEPLGSVFDISANQERRAQADGEAALREKLAYNA